MRSIRRRCACGCGEVTNYGKKYIRGHNDSTPSEEAKQKISLSLQGVKKSKEHKTKIALSLIKHNPDYEYCGAWKDEEYKKDIRKDYCENVDCYGIYSRLHNHHINLNKKDCRPFNIMTLCNSCHKTLHHIFQQVGNRHSILTINRPDKITYIHKRTRQVIATITRIPE